MLKQPPNVENTEKLFTVFLESLKPAKIVLLAEDKEFVATPEDITLAYLMAGEFNAMIYQELNNSPMDDIEVLRRMARTMAMDYYYTAVKENGGKPPWLE